MADAALAGVTFRASLMLLADGLGTAIDDFVYHREVAVADMAFGITAGRIEAGTVSAPRFGYTAVVAGRHALTVEHITRLGDDQAPDWPTGRGWKVTVEGRPSMVLDSRIERTPSNRMGNRFIGQSFANSAPVSGSSGDSLRYVNSILFSYRAISTFWQ